MNYNYGDLPIYRFYIDPGGSSFVYEVFPLKFLSSSIVYEKEKGQVFYRGKFDGSLIFGTDSKTIDVFGVEQDRREDWNLFWSIEQVTPYEKLYLTITKEGMVEPYWEGFFLTANGKFDIDNCTFEVIPLVIDDYNDILDKGNVEYNIIQIPTKVTTTVVYKGTNYVYNRNRWLARIGSDSVIEYIAGQILGAGITIESDFFTDDPNPITLENSHLLYLTIAQKSDISRWYSPGAATMGGLSWNELMDILWSMFQVKWTYDLATKTIRVEHISWFTHPAGIDLRTQLSCDATNKCSYLKEEMPKYERFSFAEASNVNFIGTPIWYNSGAVNQDPDSNSIETSINVTTDLEYIIDAPGSINDDGFVILCNYLSGGSYYVRGDFGRYDNSFYCLNMDLSVANLQNSYCKFERVLIEGYMNGTLQTFYTARKTKQQECSAILCDELDPMGEITTELGETYFGGAKAIIKTATITPSGETKFALLYGPLPNGNSGVPDNIFGVYAYPSLDSTIDPDDTVDIYFLFNIPCPGDFNVRVREYVYDNLGALHDLGAWESFTFLTGTINYAFTPVYLHQISTGWHVRLEFEYTGSEIDIFRGVDPPPSFMFGSGLPNAGILAYIYTIL